MMGGVVLATQTIENEMKAVVFALKQKEYAIDVKHVVSIEKMQNYTRVPHVPPYVKGVINLRGVITPIIDLRTRFQMETKPYDQNTRIIIVSVDDKEVGLIVDGANDVVNNQEKEIEPQPDVIGSEKQNFISGVLKFGDRLFILLKLENVLNIQEDKVS